VKLLSISTISLAAAIGAASSAVEQSCDRYAALNRLPDRFEEIASGDFGKAELFVLTDGTCTCDNKPAVDRVLGKPAPKDVNWLCNTATAEERRND
jgi:hypothetical protein